MRRLALLLLALYMAACAPVLHPPGAAIQDPKITETAFIAVDGVRLPLRSWLPERNPKAVLLALHGFNDYRQAFAAAAAWWAERGLLVYAYDQRGFGETVEVGIWGGTDNMVGDLVDVVRAVRRRHPDPPIVLLGSSMGGAVIVRNTRRLRFHLSSACPDKALFRLAAERLTPE